MPSSNTSRSAKTAKNAATPASRSAKKPAFKVSYKFSDDTQHALSMEELIFQHLTQYARMFLSDDLVLRQIGNEKLREVAKLLAEKENASLFGKIQKQKQIQKTIGKNDDYTLFLDGQLGITNTKKLAGLLQDQFGINSFRSCEDTVRAWKQAKKILRSARAA